MRPVRLCLFACFMAMFLASAIQAQPSLPPNTTPASSSAIEPLLAALDDTKPSVRNAAARSLGRLRDPRAVKPLVAGLYKWHSSGFAVGLGLSGRSEPMVVEALIDALKCENRETRREAAWALGELKANDAVKALADALRHKDSEVRNSAADALGKIKDLRAGDALLAALDDPPVKFAAERALHAIRFRRWTDREGRLLAAAAFVERKEGMVTLRKSDATELRRPIDDFALADRRYARICEGEDESRARSPIENSEQAREARAKDLKQVDDLSEAIRRNPNDADLYLRRAQLWKTAGSVEWQDRARNDLDEAVRRKPGDADVLALRGEFAMTQLGDWDQAIADFQGVLRHRPADAQARQKLARAYSGRAFNAVWWTSAVEEPEKAMADVEEARRLDPQIAGYHYVRGMVWSRMRQSDKAIADFDESLRLKPDDWSIFHERGVERYNRGEYGRAVTDFNEVVRSMPDNVSFRIERGQALCCAGEYEKALADFNLAVQLEPTSRSAFSARAWLLAVCPDEKYRNARLALLDAKDAVAIDSAHDSLESLAAAYAEAGQFDEAVKSQEKAIVQAEHAFEPVDAEFIEDMQARLKLYQARKPYRIERPER